ncbi:glucose oxidase [Phaffia rhodozyma]|uniref:Glucose oxidase n=1 Tax=Phaffia rhodozyma TaxID=264483 RepID=A0A0F7ST12_PHARH|nr:glucose oxidase [Phaffia rhodozyma]
MLRSVYILPLAFLIANFSVISQAAPLVSRQINALSRDPSVADQKEFDYIVIGGGLAGLTVANRLSEDANVTVLVIEAGRDDRTDGRVYNIANYGQFYGTDLDWSWKTTAGKAIGGGKTLGGSSSINGAHYTRGEKAQYDTWGSLIPNSTWNWDTAFKYMKKAERIYPPNDDQRAAGANYNPEYHGTSGPLEVTFPQYMYKGPGQPNFNKTISESFGVPYSPDLNGGSAAVVSFTLTTLNPDSNYERSSSASAYFSPIEHVRDNIVVLIEHQAVNIELSSEGSDTVKATGVNFKSTTGGTSSDNYLALAKREVIVASGAIQSPALLQYSGIGPASVLESAGVTVQVDLPGVGKNLNEQTSTVLGYTPDDGVEFDGSGPSDNIAFPSFKALFPNDSDSVASDLQGKISQYAADALNAGAIVSQSAGETLFDAQRKLIVEGGAGLAELFFDSGFPNGGFGLDTWGLLPFSRGTVEITSNDSFTPPKVDARYFAVDFDKTVQIAAMRLGRQVFQTSPLSQYVSGENSPGLDTVPDNSEHGSSDDWSKWIDDSFGSVSHPIATCAMMTRELGGVVDDSLLVYGTSNIRVVDASVIPLQLSAHLSASVYGVAEYAADQIKASQ